MSIVRRGVQWVKEQASNGLAWCQGELQEAAVQGGSIGKVASLALGLSLLLQQSAVFAEEATGTVTLPAMPVDFAALLTSGLVVVGVLLVACAGTAIVVYVSRRGIGAVLRALFGKA